MITLKISGKSQDRLFHNQENNWKRKFGGKTHGLINFTYIHTYIIFILHDGFSYIMWNYFSHGGYVNFFTNTYKRYKLLVIHFTSGSGSLAPSFQLTLWRSVSNRKFNLKFFEFYLSALNILRHEQAVCLLMHLRFRKIIQLKFNCEIRVFEWNGTNVNCSEENCF